MKIAFFSSKQYDINSFGKHQANHKFKFYDTRLTEDTVYLAKNYDAICIFVNDVVNKQVIDKFNTGIIKIKTPLDEAKTDELRNIMNNSNFWSSSDNKEILPVYFNQVGMQETISIFKEFLSEKGAL